MTRKLLISAWVIVCLALVGSVASSAFDGRWKDDGNGGCVFDPTDTGPDQCSPENAPQVPTGRFKDDGNGGCFFDANDSGPDQCTPPSTEPTGAAVTSRAAETASTRAQ
jgi:hypothetical protein